MEDVRATQHEDSALHALFIWYLRLRCNLIHQYLRRYQPGDDGLILTNLHLLQANPSYADPESCGGRFASVLDVLNSVCAPPDDEATRFIRFICLLSAVSSDARILNLVPQAPDSAIFHRHLQIVYYRLGLL